MSLAALAGDEQKVASLLANHPSTLKERSLFGQTPIHLATFYPCCLRLLLQGPGRSLVDQPDSNGYTPLHYAALSCTEPCEASVDPILEADCRLPNEYSGVFSCLCQNCRGKILRHIKNRRERLKRYALKRLPSVEAAALGLHHPSVLDSKANLVTQALERRGFEIPWPLRLDPCLPAGSSRSGELDEEFDRYQSVSMFHQNPLNSPLDANLEIPFRLGFRDFDSPLVPSPLLSWLSMPRYINFYKNEIWEKNRYKACIWLIEHGCNLWDPIPGDVGATTAHYLYYAIGEDISIVEVPETTRSRILLLTRLLSTQDVRDGCRCRCSLGGCSPFVWFLRSSVGMISTEWYHLENHKPELISRFVDFLKQWPPIITAEQLRSAIRYLTFKLLDIRHTCSHHGRFQTKRVCDEDIDELMSEDSSLLKVLEELVGEFDLELQAHITEEDPLGLPFWNSHWPRRMEEVTTKLKRDRMTQDELLATQQLGVTWHQLEDSPGQCRRNRRTRGSYRESDWSIEFDEKRMWRTLRSLEDWRSRLDLIMSRAIPDWR